VCLALRGTVGRSATNSTQCTQQASCRGYHTIARSWTAAALHRASGLGDGIRVSHGDGFQGAASEERRCFGVRAAERSADAALVLPEEANPRTPIRIPIRSTASHEEPRNPQRRHLRSLNEWPWGAAFCRTARRDVSAIQRHQTKPARIRSGFEPAGGVRSAEDYQRTCSRKRSVTGICWVTEGDSSSMKYQRTPAFSAAFRMAGQFS
jgi:hypothetical protein